MILQQLFIDSDAILQDVPTPQMYDYISVKWEVQLTIAGKLKGNNLVPLGENGIRHCVPYNYGRSSDIVPNLLVDTADYALGVLDKDAAKKHSAFLTMMRRCAQETNNPLVHSVLHFLEEEGFPTERLPKDLKSKDRVMFTVEGQKPTDEPEVRRFWNDLTTSECKGKLKPRGSCAITDEPGYLERILPGDIAVPYLDKKTNTTKYESAPLISVNESAGNSYGFKQALNGAVSLRAAEGFTKALNALMRNPHTRLIVGDVTYVFWNKRGGDTEASDILNRPDESADLVKRLFNTPYNPAERIANRTADRLADRFFALALSGNKTRVVFRDWLALTEWEFKDNLRSWLKGQQIISPEGEIEPDGRFRYFSVYQFAAALYRDNKDIRKADVPALVRVALHGEPLPRRMLSAVVHRCCLTGRITHARAALLSLARYDKENPNPMEVVDVDNLFDYMKQFNNNPDYVCGRLLALLEKIQYDALGPVNTGIIDRYFGAAAANPKRFIGTILLSKAESAHLPKIRKQKGPGIYLARKDEMESLLTLLAPANALGVPMFKEKLSLEEQADFLLGYYHQHAYYRAEQKKRAAEAGQKKKAQSEKTLTA